MGGRRPSVLRNTTRRIAGKHWRVGVDDVAEEYDSAKAERGGHVTTSGWTGPPSGSGLVGPGRQARRHARNDARGLSPSRPPGQPADRRTARRGQVDRTGRFTAGAGPT